MRQCGDAKMIVYHAESQNLDSASKVHWINVLPPDENIKKVTTDAQRYSRFLPRHGSGLWLDMVVFVYLLNGDRTRGVGFAISNAASRSYDYRRVDRILDDAGLLKLTTGPRGGFGTATFEWFPLAFLQPIERPALELDPEDAEALASLA
jgi:hypothetical protein